MPVLNVNSTLARSAGDFIRSSLRLVGALRSGQNLTNDELTDCMQVFNDMLDAFSVERIMIPAITVQSLDQEQNPLALEAGKQSYSVGNVNQNEDFLMPRPTRVVRVSVFYSASQQTPSELPMEMYDSVQWQGISNKSAPSTLPQVCFADDSNAVFPDTILNFWPVPTQANPVTLYLWQMLQQFADAKTKYLFQPAYSEMLRFNGAVRLAAEFPCDMTKFELVKEIAATSKDRIATMNVRPLEAVCDEALAGSNGSLGNIFSGSGSRSLKF